MHLEGAQRVFVVGGGENHRRGRGAQQFQHLEAVEFRHAHIEQHHGGLQLGDLFDGFEAVGTFAHQLHARQLGQVFAQQEPRRLFVFHHQDAQRTVFVHSQFSSAGSAGRSSSTSQVVSAILTRIDARPP